MTDNKGIVCTYMTSLALLTPECLSSSGLSSKRAQACLANKEKGAATEVKVEKTFCRCGHLLAQPVRPWFVLLQEYTRERGLQVPIEVEARTLQEVHEVLAVLDADPGCVDRIMLDNMTRLDPTLQGAPNTAPLHASLQRSFRCSVK